MKKPDHDYRKYEALASLLIAMKAGTQNDMKWAWANDPKHDGAITWCRTAFGRVSRSHNVQHDFDKASLQNTVDALSRSYFDIVYKQVDEKTPDGGTYRKTVADPAYAASDEFNTKIWQIARPVAETVLARLERDGDPRTAENLKHYYDEAVRTFGGHLPKPGTETPKL